VCFPQLNSITLSLSSFSGSTLKYDFLAINIINNIMKYTNLGDLVAILGSVDFVLGSIDLLHYYIIT